MEASIPSELDDLFQGFAEQAIATSRPGCVKALLQRLWELTPSSKFDKQEWCAVLENAISWTAELAAALPPLPPPQPQPRPQLYQLELSHDCQASGCQDTSCVLCKENDKRRCSGAINPKSFSEEALQAGCGAPVKVSVVAQDANSDLHHLQPFHIQVCVVTEQKCIDSAWADLPRHALLTFTRPKEGQRCVLQLGADAQATLHDNGFVTFPAAGSRSPMRLPAMGFAESGQAVVKASEAAAGAVKGRRFGLALRAVDAHGQPLDHLIRPVFSNMFTVTTKRTKKNKKPDIPSYDTEVSKIEGVGDATKPKLLALHTINAAQLRELVNSVRGDNAKCNHLRTTLGMTTDKWDDMVAHVGCVVDKDDRLRLFTLVASEQPRHDLGLVFACSRGKVELWSGEYGLVGYVERRGGTEHFVQWARVQSLELRRFALETLLSEARAAWPVDGHPGWDFFHYRGDTVAHTALPDASYPIPYNARPAAHPRAALTLPSCMMGPLSGGSHTLPVLPPRVPCAPDEMAAMRVDRPAATVVSANSRGNADLVAMHTSFLGGGATADGAAPRQLPAITVSSACSDPRLCHRPIAQPFVPEGDPNRPFWPGTLPSPNLPQEQPSSPNSGLGSSRYLDELLRNTWPLTCEAEAEAMALEAAERPFSDPGDVPPRDYPWTPAFASAGLVCAETRPGAEADSLCSDAPNALRLCAISDQPMGSSPPMDSFPAARPAMHNSLLEGHSLQHSPFVPSGKLVSSRDARCQPFATAGVFEEEINLQNCLLDPQYGSLTDPLPMNSSTQMEWSPRGSEQYSLPTQSNAAMDSVDARLGMWLDEAADDPADEEPIYYI